MLSRIKNLFSSFKTLEGVISGNLFLIRASQKFCMQYEHAKLYALRYNVTSCIRLISHYCTLQYDVTNDAIWRTSYCYRRMKFSLGVIKTNTIVLRLRSKKTNNFWVFEYKSLKSFLSLLNIIVYHLRTGFTFICSQKDNCIHQYATASFCSVFTFIWNNKCKFFVIAHVLILCLVLTGWGWQ